MMKSFFKKLAFVMALAMVVTTAAPAANVFAAEFGIVAQDDKTWTIVETVDVEVDEKADFKFVGAPSNWASLGFTWTSSDEEVATVSQAGIVTGVADGVATITLSDKAGEYVATLEVTVGEGEKEVSDAFTVAQKSDTKVELTFANTEITAEDLASLRFYYYVGETQITYPFQLKEVKNGVATIVSYMSFVDGWTYGFEYAEEAQEFEATIGDVVAIIPSYKSDTFANHAYAGAETDINYTLVNAQGVDITESVKARGGSVEFFLVEEADNGEFWLLDSDEGIVWLDVEGAAARVQIKYYTGKYDETTWEPVVGASTIVTLVAEKPVAYGIDSSYMPVATIAKAGEYDLKKPNKIIALDDDANVEHTLVVELKDNRGNKVNTEDGPASGSFYFASTNNAKLYVAEDGTLMTNAKGVTNVLVYYKAEGADYGNVVAVVPVDVRAKRAVTTMKLSNTKVTVSTADPYDTAEVSVELKDQLGADIAGTLSYEVETKLPNGVNVAPAVSIDGNKVTVVGSEANLPAKANNYSYTIAVKCGSSVVQKFTVNVRKPDATKISGYKVEFSQNVTDIKATKDGVDFTTEVKLFNMSNGVKYSRLNLIKMKPDAANTVTVGGYYYTVTKDGKALAANKVSVNDGVLNIGLTKTETKTLTGSASGTAIDVINKGANGAGNYTVIIFQAVGKTGTTTASSFKQIARETVTIKDTQDTMSYAGKAKNTTTNTNVEEVVKECFKFTLGNTTLETKDGTNNYGEIVIDVHANGVGDDNATIEESVVFIKSVDFYVPVENSTAHVKYTVKVNDYVEVVPEN